MSDQLKEKMLGALAWSSVDRVAQQAVQLLIGIALARLLSPADYGLMGMVMIFATLSYVLVESGFNYALVRTKELDDRHASTVFYTNLAISLTLYLAFFATAPLIAAFFGQPRLTAIARVTFLAILFNASYLVPFAIIGKRMDYKSLAKTNIIGTVCGGIAGIVLAWKGFGVWALVAQQTGYHFFRIFGFYWFTRWRPRLIFSFDVIRGYRSFTLPILGSSLLTACFNNLYPFLLGKYYPVREVGFYTQAYKVSDAANFMFVSILNSTTYNLFAQIHEQRERVARILRTMIHRTSVVVIPVTLGLILIAKPLFFTLFGEKWLQAVPYFQLLCTANLLAPLHQMMGNALNAIGKSRVTFHLEIIKRSLILLSVFLVFWKFDKNITAMLLGYIVANYVGFFCAVFCVWRFLATPCLEQLADLLHGLVLGAACCLTAYGASQLAAHCCPDNLYLQFAVIAATAATTYLLLIRFVFKTLWHSTMDFILSKLGIRKPKPETNDLSA